MKKNTVTGFMLLALALGTGFVAQAQTPEQRAKIVNSYDKKAIDEAKAAIKENEENYKLALELAAANGWPLEKRTEDGQVSILKGVYNNQPIYISNFNDGFQGSAFTSRVLAIRPDGSLGLDLTGAGMTVGMWEIGAPRLSHVDFADRITIGDNASFDGHNESNDHATHVAGTLIGAGLFNSDARGIAYEANLRAYNASSDDSEALNAATNLGLLVSNHSYGFRYFELVGGMPWIGGCYNNEARTWDLVTYAAPYYLPVISAGNERVNQGEMKDLLVGNKVSKNVLTVAATLPLAAGGYVDHTSIAITDFSSYGPADDRRVKPDIATKGFDVLSASSSGTTDYVSKNGTSMAAPGIAGALILLQQHYSNVNEGNFMRAATLKALVVNTADEAGAFPGPDHKYGWGLINAEKAADLITKAGTESIIKERTLNFGETYSFPVTALGTRPIKATLCWTDPAAPDQSGSDNNLVADLICNLDIKITKTGEADHLPWRLADNVTSAPIKAVNNVDNVEKVEINNPVGEYTVTISHQGTLNNFSSQDYSLVIDGVSEEMSIVDNELNGKISVYPNPATDVINIVFDATIGKDNCTIALYDLQGRVVKQYNKYVETIDVSGLSAGLYMLSIEKDGANTAKKIIVQ